MYSLFGSSIYLDLKSEQMLEKQPNPSIFLIRFYFFSEGFYLAVSLYISLIYRIFYYKNKKDALLERTKWMAG